MITLFNLLLPSEKPAQLLSLFRVCTKLNGEVSNIYEYAILRTAKKRIKFFFRCLYLRHGTANSNWQDHGDPSWDTQKTVRYCQNSEQTLKWYYVDYENNITGGNVDGPPSIPV